MLKDLFKPKEKNVSPSSDRFKPLIRTLSVMTDIELDKVEKLISLVFDQKQQKNQVHPSEPVSPVIQEESLDDRIETARARLKTEELEKQLQQFKQSKK